MKKRFSIVQIGRCDIEIFRKNMQKLFLDFVTFLNENYLTFTIFRNSCNNYLIILLALTILKSGLLFCAFNITRDTENVVQISILLNKTKIVKILKEFFVSRAILKAQKM